MSLSEVIGTPRENLTVYGTPLPTTTTTPTANVTPTLTQHQFETIIGVQSPFEQTIAPTVQNTTVSPNVTPSITQHEFETIIGVQSPFEQTITPTVQTPAIPQYQHVSPSVQNLVNRIVTEYPDVTFNTPQPDILTPDIPDLKYFSPNTQELVRKIISKYPNTVFETQAPEFQFDLKAIQGMDMPSGLYQKSPDADLRVYVEPTEYLTKYGYRPEDATYMFNTERGKIESNIQNLQDYVTKANEFEGQWGTYEQGITDTLNQIRNAPDEKQWWFDKNSNEIQDPGELLSKTDALTYYQNMLNDVNLYENSILGTLQSIQNAPDTAEWWIDTNTNNIKDSGETFNKSSALSFYQSERQRMGSYKNDLLSTINSLQNESTENKWWIDLNKNNIQESNELKTREEAIAFYENEYATNLSIHNVLSGATPGTDEMVSITDAEKLIGEMKTSSLQLLGYQEAGYGLTVTDKGYEFIYPKASDVVKNLYKGQDLTALYTAQEMRSMGMGVIGATFSDLVTGGTGARVEEFESASRSILGTRQNIGESTESYIWRSATSPEVLTEIVIPVATFGASKIISAGGSFISKTAFGTRIAEAFTTTGPGARLSDITAVAKTVGEFGAKHPVLSYVGGKTMKYGMYGAFEGGTLIDVAVNRPEAFGSTLARSLWNWEVTWGAMEVGFTRKPTTIKTDTGDVVPIREPDFYAGQPVTEDLYMRDIGVKMQEHYPEITVAPDTIPIEQLGINRIYSPQGKVKVTAQRFIGMDTRVPAGQPQTYFTGIIVTADKPVVLGMKPAIMTERGPLSILGDIPRPLRAGMEITVTPDKAFMFGTTETIYGSKAGERLMSDFTAYAVRPYANIEKSAYEEFFSGKLKVTELDTGRIGASTYLDVGYKAPQRIRISDVFKSNQLVEPGIRSDIYLSELKMVPRGQEPIGIKGYGVTKSGYSAPYTELVGAKTVVSPGSRTEFEYFGDLTKRTYPEYNILSIHEQGKVFSKTPATEEFLRTPASDTISGGFSGGAGKTFYPGMTENEAFIKQIEMEFGKGSANYEKYVAGKTMRLPGGKEIKTPSGSEAPLISSGGAEGRLLTQQLTKEEIQTMQQSELKVMQGLSGLSSVTEQIIGKDIMETGVKELPTLLGERESSLLFTGMAKTGIVSTRYASDLFMSAPETQQLTSLRRLSLSGTSQLPVNRLDTGLTFTSILNEESMGEQKTKVLPGVSYGLDHETILETQNKQITTEGLTTSLINKTDSDIDFDRRKVSDFIGGGITIHPDFEIDVVEEKEWFVPFSPPTPPYEIPISDLEQKSITGSFTASAIDFIPFTGGRIITGGGGFDFGFTPIFPIPPIIPKDGSAEGILIGTGTGGGYFRPRKRKRRPKGLPPDLLSVTLSQAQFGSATAPKETKALFRESAKHLFIRTPTVEMMKGAKRRVIMDTPRTDLISANPMINFNLSNKRNLDVGNKNIGLIRGNQMRNNILQNRKKGGKKNAYY